MRLNRSDSGTFENLDGWMTTVIGRVCLDMLRSRKAPREESLDAHVPDLSLSRDDRFDPERDVVIADPVGLALLVALETLCPPERLAFVLHDMFAVPFEEIGSIVGCSPAAARQLASRARRRPVDVRPQAPFVTENSQIDNYPRKMDHSWTNRFENGQLESNSTFFVGFVRSWPFCPGDIWPFRASEEPPAIVIVGHFLPEAV